MSSVIKSVVVVRHGERLDYITRDNGGNWISTSDRPWDPPLTDNGKNQASELGKALPDILQKLNLPPIVAIYSSPFLRCRQTSVGLIKGGKFCDKTANDKDNNNDDDDGLLKVRVELGLSESLNENWYRSWAVHGSDGTWGFQKKTHPELDPDTLHEASKKPVQPLLDWKKAISSDETIMSRMDEEYVSKSNLDTPYSLHPPKFESYKTQRERMRSTLDQLSNETTEGTLVLVSHGA